MFVKRSDLNPLGAALSELLFVGSKNTFIDRLEKQLKKNGATNPIQLLAVLIKGQSSTYPHLALLAERATIVSTYFMESADSQRRLGLLVTIPLASDNPALVAHYFIPRLTIGLHAPHTGKILSYPNLPHVTWLSGNTETKDHFHSLGMGALLQNREGILLTPRLEDGSLPPPYWTESLAMMDPTKAFEKGLMACFPDEDVQHAVAAFLESFGKP